MKNELKDYSVNFAVGDPPTDPHEAQFCDNIQRQPFEKIRRVEAVIPAVSHQVYRDRGLAKISGLCAESSALVVGVKGYFNPDEGNKLGVSHLRL